MKALLSDSGSFLKKSLTGPTLLEMSGNPTDLGELDRSSGITLTCDWTSAAIQAAASLVGATALDSKVAAATDTRTLSWVANLVIRRNVNSGPSKQGTVDTTLGWIEGIVSVAEAQPLCVELEPARLSRRMDDLSSDPNGPE